MITLQPMNIVSAAADLLWSRVIKQFPSVKIALSEGGTGWIPYFLERLDRTFEMHATWTLQDFGGKLPSEVFREHFLTCFISDSVGVGLRHEIGIDNIAWECDYPHSDSLWPSAAEHLLRRTSSSTTCRTRTSTRSRTRTRCAGTVSTRSGTCRRSRRPWARCARRSRGTISRSGREATTTPAAEDKLAQFRMRAEAAFSKATVTR